MPEPTSPPSADRADAFRVRLDGAPWVVHREPAATGERNMARDLDLLRQAIDGVPAVLRLYEWSPACLSLGRFQREEAIAVEEVRRRGWDIVRRPTGGRAVLHQHELTYAIVLSPEVTGGIGVTDSYRELAGRIAAGLAALLPSGVRGMPGTETCRARPGAPSCFAVGASCDTLVAGRKLVGSAQLRRDGALLQHGSILLRADREAWRAILGDPGELVTLEQLCGSTPDIDRVAEAIRSAVCAA